MSDALAQPAAARAAQPGRAYCLFRAGGQVLCLPMDEVQEFLEWPAVTPVPLAPPFVLGVFNARGSVVPVLELTGAPRSAGSLPPYVVVAGRRQEGEPQPLRVAIAVDELLVNLSAAGQSPPRHSDPPYAGGHVVLEDGSDALVVDLGRLPEALPVPVI